MADSENLVECVARLSARFDRIEGQLSEIRAQCGASSAGRDDATAAVNFDTAGRRQVDIEDEQRPLAHGAGIGSGSYSEIQQEFRAIKESVAKLKLPADLVVGDSRAGISRGDLPKFSVIQKSARFQETVLKLLSTSEGPAAAQQDLLSSITTVTLAHLRYLQEEYTQLLVSSQFDEGTTKLFTILQQNPAAFPPNALENLQRAVAIAGARPRQVSWAPQRGRKLGPPLSFTRGSGRGYQHQPFRRSGPGAPPADWASRGRPDLAGRPAFPEARD